jgi:DNA invertase Pin-like site-specific DNA recombinase
MMSVKKCKTVRCAVYCNSNLDGGGAADQNAIRVQTQMAEAYIAGQQGRGWVGLPEKYEDIAQPGGALKRPGLQKLMADAEAGKMDEVLTANFECVTRSNVDRVSIIKHFRRCKVGVMETGIIPEHISKLWRDCLLRTMASTGNKGPGPGTAQPDKVRFAAYMRGDVDSLKRQRQDLAKFLERPKFYLQSWADPYADCEPSTSPSGHPTLKKLLKDVDGDRLDCVVVHTFDRLTDGLIGHEELLARFRQHDVSLMTLGPEFYHVWGRRMEEKWIASMRWYLHETQRRVRKHLHR